MSVRTHHSCFNSSSAPVQLKPVIRSVHSFCAVLNPTDSIYRVNSSVGPSVNAGSSPLPSSEYRIIFNKPSGVSTLVLPIPRTKVGPITLTLTISTPSSVRSLLPSFPLTCSNYAPLRRVPKHACVRTCLRSVLSLVHVVIALRSSSCP
jgi:hypothetical protein